VSAESIHDVDPRVLRTRQSVIAATQDALGEEGYAAITIDGIARRSGVARTTIYRHWGSLADLVIEAVTLIDEQWAAPDTGCVRDDLVAQGTRLNEKLSTSEWGRALPTLVDGSSRDPELLRLHTVRTCQRRDQTIALVDRGIIRGELPAGVDATLVVDRIAGPIFYHHLILHQPIDKAYIARLVDDVLAPFLVARGERQRSR
jgi:AcrR family transcriptional regulator